MVQLVLGGRCVYTELMDRARVDGLDKKLWPEMEELGAAWRVMSHCATRCVCIFLPMPC